MSFNSDLNKYNPRKEQSDVIDFIAKKYLDSMGGDSKKFFLFNLPPGIGKSHLSLMIIDWYRKSVNNSAKFDIITNSKLLQDQYISTYTSMNDMRGKENYECSTYACSCSQGMEFNKLNNTKCDNCPYIDARTSFVSGGISLTNFYLYLIHVLYMDTMTKRGANVLIVDECHELDDVMSNFISMNTTDSIIKKYKLKNEVTLLSSFSKVTTIEDYIVFLHNLRSDVDDKMATLEKSFMENKISDKEIKRKSIIEMITNKKSVKVKLLNEINDLYAYSSKINIIIRDYNKDKSNWIFERKINHKNKQVEINIEPIWVSEYLFENVYAKYDAVFMMSGTILNKNLFCSINGIDPNNTAYHSIPSPFKKENRKIYYMPIGKMTYNEKESTFEKYIPYIQKLLNKYFDKKGIIHTNSFELANKISERIKNPRLIFHNSTNKDEQLNEHYKSKEPTVIVSPSMDTGVSFDDDYARFQIIAKVPYPSLASKRNLQRKSDNPEWYAWKTAAVIQQACGRIVRSYDDYGDTIIIDESFGDLLRYSSHYFPIWFQDSIKTINLK